MSDLVKPENWALVHPSYGLWPGVVPLPAPEMMATSGALTAENFLVVGDAWSQVVQQRITPESTVLDVGCGCGKTARMLVHHPYIARYLGFDVLEECVRWCQRYVSAASPRFEFLYSDIYSAEYRPHGRIRATEFRFPMPDGAVDVALAASVFTHLLEPDARHYLRELARVLKATGTAIVSIHIHPEPGREFSGTETRIEILPEHFVRLAADAGLSAERIGDLCGQEAYLLMKRELL